MSSSIYLFTSVLTPGAPEALRPPRPQSWLLFESPFHRLSEAKKILKIRLKLAEIEVIF